MTHSLINSCTLCTHWIHNVYAPIIIGALHFCHKGLGGFLVCKKTKQYNPGCPRKHIPIRYITMTSWCYNHARACGQASEKEGALSCHCKCCYALLAMQQIASELSSSLDFVHPFSLSWIIDRSAFRILHEC